MAAPENGLVVLNETYQSLLATTVALAATIAALGYAIADGVGNLQDALAAQALQAAINQDAQNLISQGVADSIEANAQMMAAHTALTSAMAANVAATTAIASAITSVQNSPVG